MPPHAEAPALSLYPAPPTAPTVVLETPPSRANPVAINPCLVKALFPIFLPLLPTSSKAYFLFPSVLSMECCPGCSSAWSGPCLKRQHHIDCLSNGWRLLVVPPPPQGRGPERGPHRVLLTAVSDHGASLQLPLLMSNPPVHQAHTSAPSYLGTH